MTLSVLNLSLLGFRNSNDSPSADVPYSTAANAADYVIPDKHIDSISIKESINEWVDTAKFSIDNYDGRYVMPEETFRYSDRIALWLALDTDPEGDYESDVGSFRPSSSQFGGAQFGSAQFGGTVSEDPSSQDALSHRWTGHVTESPNNNNGGNSYTIELTAGDYVFQILKNRRITRDFRGLPIGGGEDAILNRALASEAPELGRSQIQSVGETTDLTWNRRTLLDLLKVCVSRGDAVAWADDRSLIFRPTDTVSPRFTITHDSGDWYGGMQTNNSPDSFANSINMVGGTQPLLDDYQEQVDTTAALTNTMSGMQTVELSPKGDRIAQVEVWTDPDTDSDGVPVGDGIAARIQRDENGGPVAPTDKQSDLASGQVEVTDLTPGGWTRINISDGSVSRDTAWLILQSMSAGGQTIGVREDTDGNTTPTFRTYYPYDVAVVEQDDDSVDRYGVVDDAIADDSLDTSQSAEDAALSRARHRGQIPHRIDSVRAWSERMHSLQPTDLVNIDAPKLTAHGGAYVVTDRETEISGGELTTGFSLHELATL